MRAELWVCSGRRQSWRSWVPSTALSDRGDVTQILVTIAALQGRSTSILTAPLANTDLASQGAPGTKNVNHNQKVPRAVIK